MLNCCELNSIKNHFSMRMMIYYFQIRIYQSEFGWIHRILKDLIPQRNNNKFICLGKRKTSKKLEQSQYICQSINFMDLTIAGGIALTSLYHIFQLRGDITSIQATLNEMEGLPTCSPGQIYHLLNQGKDIMKYFKESDGGETLKGKIFLEGSIDARYPIKSLLTDRDLIYRQLFVDKIYSNDRGITQVNKFSSRKLIPFTKNNDRYERIESSPYMDLYNYQQGPSYNQGSISYESAITHLKTQPHQNSSLNNNSISVRILKNIEANYQHALDLIHLKNHYKKLNFAENVIMVLGIVIEFLSSMLHIKIRGRGIKIGYQEIEYGIAVKQFISIFGELIFNRKTGQMVMKKPEFFFSQKASLTNGLKNKIYDKKVLITLLCVPLVLSGFYLYQKLFKIICQFIRKQRQRKEDQLKKMTGLEIDHLACKVCNQNVRNIIFKPCHHLTHCKQCFEDMIKDKNGSVGQLQINNHNQLSNHSNSLILPQDIECSICKANVTSIVEVFVS